MGLNTYLFSYLSLLIIGCVLSLVAHKLSRGTALSTRIIVTFFLLIIGYYFFTVYQFSSNVPYTDDYEILRSVSAMLDATTFKALLEALFKQVNEHRFAFERACIWVYYALMGEFSIKAQILVGNFFLIGIVSILYRVFTQTALPLLYFSPVVLLLFNLTFYENSLWAIAALQNTALIFFALTVAYALSKPRALYGYLALLACILASFTSGSGLVLWFIGVVVLLAQRRYRFAGIWVAVMLPVLIFYFSFDYQFASKEMSALWRHPFLNLLQLLAFFGNVLIGDFAHVADYGRIYADVALAAVCGAGIGLVFVALFIKISTDIRKNEALQPQYWFGFMATSFCMATGLMLVLSRPISNNLFYEGDVFSRRYMIFGAVLLACTYLVLIPMLRSVYVKSGLAVLATLGALSIHINSYLAYIPTLTAMKQELDLDHFYWVNHKMLLSFGENYQDKLYWNHPQKMMDVLDDLQEKKLLVFEESMTPEHADSLIGETEATNETTVFRISRQPERGWQNRWNEKVMIEGYFDPNNIQKAAYIVLRSDDNLFLLPALLAANSGRAFLGTKRFFGSYFSYSFFKTKFPAAQYELWLLEKDRQGRWRAKPTNAYLTLSDINEP